MMSRNILIINGSYRQGGITDQAVAALKQALTNYGLNTDTVNLREQKIEFCLNCRECMQNPGSAPEPCVQDDEMTSIVAKIEAADGYVLAAPTNLGSVTAIFKRFMERLAVYAYWPWGANGPEYRKDDQPRKKAIIVTSSAAPRILGRWIFGTTRQLKYTADIMGADTIGVLYSGLIAKEPNFEIPPSIEKKASDLAFKML